MTPSSPKVSVRNGFGLVPEDRRESGLVLNLSVERNIALTVLDRLQRFLFLDERATRDLAHQYVERIHIKTPGIQQRVKNLSGGNQQKVVLSKWLAANTRILLLDEPTRGIDVGAKAEIYHLINELAEQGLSVLMASSELVEILGLSDRVLVMAEGRVTGELVTASTSQEEIMRYAVVKAPAQTVSA
jgi:ABC-type sugar transport system ATPase subunit